MEGEVEWKIHHCAVIIGKVGLGKNHQWMTNLGNNFDEEQDLSMW